MKRTKLLARISLICVGALAIYTLKLKKEKNLILSNYENALEASQLNDDLKTGLLNNAYGLQQASWVHSIYGINEEIILTNQDKSKTKLIDKLEGFTLLFSFNSNMCNPCIDREIENMKLLSKKFKNINLIITTQGLPANYVFKDQKFKGLDANIFIVNTPLLKASSIVESPTFILFDNKNPLFFFHPAKNHNRAFEMLLQVFQKTLSDP